MIPGFVELTKVVLTCDASTATPFSVSLISTLVKVVPPFAPLIGVPISLTASIAGAMTIIFTVVSSQFVGFKTSQIL